MFKKTNNKKYLIVGLGNPGKEYENTRHNIGYKVLDQYANHKNQSIEKEKMLGLYTKFATDEKSIILLKPLSYMNLSGSVVSKFMKYFKIPITNILIISDDLDQPQGTFKIKVKGGTGGHNGLKDISNHLKTNDFNRLKIGISNNKTIDTKDYVLGRVGKEEEKLYDKNINVFNNIIDDFIQIDIQSLMTKYNGLGK